MEEPRSHPILLISARWPSRALVAAQIAESTQRDVVSGSSVNEALGVIKLGGIEPVLLVVDAGQQIGREGLARLLEAEPDLPLVAIVSRLRRDAFETLRDRCAGFLLRPVSIGRVARTVAQVLEELP
jgi:DNA-binding NtrC family response regulator